MDFQIRVSKMQLPDRDFAGMTPSDRLQEVRNLIICYPRFYAVLDAIKECHSQYQGDNEPECLFVKGNTGTGKTTLYKTYAADYPRMSTSEGDTVRVLAVVAPASATVKGVASKLLWSLGDPEPYRGTRDTMTIRLLNLMKDCGVELIILDELNHFFDRDSDKLLKTVSDWLKELIIESRIPMVAFGLSTAEGVLGTEVNPQLSRRFSHRISLNPFQWADDDGAEFRQLLSAIEQGIPLLEKSYLSTYDMAYRFYYASDGVIAYIMKLIRNGTRLSLKEGREKLDREILALAFDTYVKQDKPKKKYNPFLDDSFMSEDLEKTSSLNDTYSGSVKATNNRIKSRKSKPLSASDVLRT